MHICWKLYTERIQFLTNILIIAFNWLFTLILYVIKYSWFTFYTYANTGRPFRLYRTDRDNRRDIQYVKTPINVLLLDDEFRSINAATYTVAA